MDETNEHVADRLRVIASELFHGTCEQTPCCLQKEEDRPLTPVERKRGWSRRPFYAYDAEKMCRGCRIYFHVEMAAQEAHEQRCWDQRIAAEEALKGK